MNKFFLRNQKISHFNNYDDILNNYRLNIGIPFDHENKFYILINN